MFSNEFFFKVILSISWSWALHFKYRFSSYSRNGAKSSEFLSFWLFCNVHLGTSPKLGTLIYFCFCRFICNLLSNKTRAKYEYNTATVFEKSVLWSTAYPYLTWGGGTKNPPIFELQIPSCDYTLMLLRAANVKNLFWFFTLHDNLFDAFWPIFIAVSCIL